MAYFTECNVMQHNTMVNIRLYEDREFRYDILMNVKVCEDRFLYLFHAKNTELILMKFDSSKFEAVSFRQYDTQIYGILTE